MNDATIRAAITQKRLIEFVLHGHVRIAEPHDYGIRNGVPQLLVYQIAGKSASGKLPDWRWVVLAQASGLKLLDQTFPGGERIGKTQPMGPPVLASRPSTAWIALNKSQRLARSCEA